MTQTLANAFARWMLAFGRPLVYECVICRHDNHVKRLQCETCGTIPAQYSALQKPAVLNRDSQFIETVIARGATRLESRRAHKVYFRTVKLDYYAS